MRRSNEPQSSEPNSDPPTNPGLPSTISVDRRPVSLETSSLGTSAQSSTQNSIPLSSLLANAVAVIAALVAGQALLSSSQLPAYRDAGHYYEPLYRWQSQSYAVSDGSLWDPHENLGRSLAADPTAASFYPPAIAMRAIPAPWPLRFNGYLLAHLLIAALGATWGARCLGVCNRAAMVSGVIYVSAGAIASQVCNSVFLVGAAWLPWTLGAGWLAITLRSKNFLFATGLTLGLMILGGDPQAAVHAVMALALAILVAPRHSSRNTQHAAAVDARNRLSRGPLGIVAILVHGSFARRQQLIMWLAIIVVASLVSAVQLVPAIEAATNSDRRVHREPRSVYEGLRDVTRKDLATPEQRVERIARGWFGTPLPGTHHAASLEFSLPPWQFAELLWPNATGRGIGVHRRWIDGIPASDRTWFPSIYMGAITIVVSLGSIIAALGRKKPVARWLLCSAGFFSLLSLGWYGIGWLVQESMQAWNGQPLQASWSPALGGFYGLAQWLIPGYADFRFPAKAFVVATLFLAWIVGNEVSRISILRWNRWTRIAAILAMVSALALLMSWWQETAFRDWCKTQIADGTFGPLSVDDAWSDLQTGIAHGLISFTLLWGCGAAGSVILKRRVSQRSERSANGSSQTSLGVPRATRNQALLAIGLWIVIDVAIAHRSAIVMAPQSLWQQPSPLAAAVHESEEGQPLRRPIMGQDAATAPMPRVYRGYWNGWTPQSWWTTSSPERMSEVIAWDRATWFPKHHRWDAVRLIEAPGSSQDASFWMLMQVARYHGWTRSDGAQEPSPAVLSALGAEWIVAPEWDAPLWTQAHSTLVPIERTDSWPESTVLFRNPDAFPEAWIVPQAVAHPAPQLHDDLDALWKWIDRGLQHEVAGVYAWRHAVLLDLSASELEAIQPESDSESIAAVATSTASETPRTSNAQIVWHSHHRVELNVQTSEPSWLVLSHAWDGGWNAQVMNARGEWEPREMVRGNFVMRAVRLEPGDQKVWMEFAPRSASIAGLVSLASCLLCVLAFVVRRPRN